MEHFGATAVLKKERICSFMETIHLKTVDPISQELLRAAAQRGVSTNWERYEKLQPQDGFLRVGLSCPYGCLQGPCRIDPFGRGPDRGLCGLDRDGMVAALFLRIVLNGVLETAGRTSAKIGGGDTSLARDAIEKLGGSPISEAEVYRSAAMLVRPSTSAERMIRQALRLGILAARLVADVPKQEKDLPFRVGYGLLGKNQPVIGIAGDVPAALAASLIKLASDTDARAAQVVSLGDWIPLADGFVPCACTSGEAELLLSSGRISLLVAGAKTDPGLMDVCKAVNVPAVFNEDSLDASELLRLAADHHDRSQYKAFIPDASLIGEGLSVSSSRTLADRIKGIEKGKFAIIGGADTLQLPLGWMPVEIAKAVGGAGRTVGAWGDAALWMAKDALSSGAQSASIVVLDPQKGPVEAVKALDAAGKLGDLSGILFTGLKGPADLATALGLAATGTRVCTALPLPVWGSTAVCGLIADALSSCGGSLTHFDHPAQTEELLNWFGVND
jgi:hypothetical protein